MKSKKEIEDYLGMKIEPYYTTEVESIYGEEQIAYDRYVLGQRIPANYRIKGEYLPERTKEALKKLIKESVEKKDMETASTCHSILSKYTSNALEGLNANQISELIQYERDEEQKLNEKNEEGRKNWHEFQSKRKAEQEAKERAEEQARLKAEQEAKERAEEQARLKAEQEAKERAEEQTRLEAEQEAKERAEEQARLKAEQEAKERAEEQARLEAEQEAKERAEEQARLKAEQEEKERQASIKKDIAEYEQYEELISRKPELDKLLEELKYEDFSTAVYGHTSERMGNLLNDLKKLPEDERKIILQQYNKFSNLTIDEQGQITKDGIVQDNIQLEIKDGEQESTKAEQVMTETIEDEPSVAGKTIEDTTATGTNIDIDSASMMEAHLEYMRNHQTQQTSQVVEDYWNEIHSKQAKVYEQPQPEKIRPREKSIKDEVGDELRKTEQHTQKQDNPSVDLWMNRFNGWYSAIDRVSQNVKNKFVKMKSDIIKAISERLKEKTNDRQVNTQEQDTNER